MGVPIVWSPYRITQFIGWWHDAGPDALTSSAYTGERAICSSDFSAFTKWPYCPSVAIFLAPYNFSDTDSPFALRGLQCLGFSHACEAVYGISKCKFCENLCLRTLRSRLEVFENESSFFPIAPRRPPWPPVCPQPGVRMSSSRRWRVNRQASPFLSLPLPSTCARIHRLNSRMIIFILARGHVTPSPSG